MLEKFYIIFVVLQETIAIKDATFHLKKIVLFLLHWKKEKLGQKILVGRKCSTS